MARLGGFLVLLPGAFFLRDVFFTLGAVGSEKSSSSSVLALLDF
jgi:hypothetical protein